MKFQLACWWLGTAFFMLVQLVGSQLDNGSQIIVDFPVWDILHNQSHSLLFKCTHWLLNPHSCLRLLRIFFGCIVFYYLWADFRNYDFECLGFHLLVYPCNVPLKLLNTWLDLQELSHSWTQFIYCIWLFVGLYQQELNYSVFVSINSSCIIPIISLSSSIMKDSFWCRQLLVRSATGVTSLIVPCCSGPSGIGTWVNPWDPTSSIVTGDW